MTAAVNFFKNRQRPIIWKNVIGLFLMHAAFIYSIIYLRYMKLSSFIFGLCYGFFASFGVVTGTHRLWSHRTYKAKIPLRIFLMICHCISGMYDTIQFVRDHRLHHKYADTNADPHNIKQGFFYAHIGWLMMKRHPELKEKSKFMNYDDVLSDPVLQFQRRYYPLLVLFFHVFLPCFITHVILQETIQFTITSFIIRAVVTLNLIWCINSIAHYCGDKPYNPNIEARQNSYMSYITFGEGYHNYHHTFPWDYRIKNNGFHFHNAFIDWMARIGQAYDLKTVPEELIKKVLQKNNNNLDYCQEVKGPYENLKKLDMMF